MREHAQAATSTVTLLERDGGHAVRIADDGCGCDPDLISAGTRRRRLREHAHARRASRGGSLRIESPPGAGTTVEAWLPSVSSAPGNGARP